MHGCAPHPPSQAAIQAEGKVRLLRAGAHHHRNMLLHTTTAFQRQCTPPPQHAGAHNHRNGAPERAVSAGLFLLHVLRSPCGTAAAAAATHVHIRGHQRAVVASRPALDLALHPDPASCPNPALRPEPAAHQHSAQPHKGIGPAMRHMRYNPLVVDVAGAVVGRAQHVLRSCWVGDHQEGRNRPRGLRIGKRGQQRQR
eukprot:166844-Chlamydomonas_euryale.AAC.2